MQLKFLFLFCCTSACFLKTETHPVISFLSVENSGVRIPTQEPFPIGTPRWVFLGIPCTGLLGVPSLWTAPSPQAPAVTAPEEGWVQIRGSHKCPQRSCAVATLMLEDLMFRVHV